MLKEKHVIIGDVRVKEMMIAVELVKDRRRKEPFILDEIFDYLVDLVERGILISLDGMRFLSPLNLTQEQADEIMLAIDQILSANNWDERSM